MIYGEGVLHKYCHIMDARQIELMTAVKSERDHQVQSDKLMEFRNQLRQCKPSEFNEWFELYKDFKVPTRLR